MKKQLQTGRKFSMSQLTRSRDNKMIGGVAAGIAKKYDVDLTIVRLVFVALALFTNILGVAAYGVLWAILPEEGSNVTGVDRLNDRYNEYRGRRDAKLASDVQDAPRDVFDPYAGDK